MKTVDIAWDIFLKKNKLNIEYKRFSIKAKEQNIYITEKIDLNYKGFFNFDFNVLTKEDIIIFWGDFIHSKHYLNKDILRISKKKKTDFSTYKPNFLRMIKKSLFKRKFY